MKLLIKGGRVIDPANNIDGEKDLLIEDGKVAEVLPPGQGPADAEVLDASGCWVTPGLIDMHVHFREPGQEYKETIATGAAAALAGGVTAVACMPNTDPVNDDGSVTDYILRQAERADLARVYPVGAVTAGSRGEELAEMHELVSRGSVAVSDDGHPVSNPELMRRALEYSASLGVPLLNHPEELELSRGGVMNEGPPSTRFGLRGIPAAAEEVMVARDIILAELTGARLHLQHLSTEGSVRLVREAKTRGVKVTAETCPHYFTLLDEDLATYNTNFKMNPPLRSKRDQEAIFWGLADGTIDVIASDHAPHSPVEKDVEFDRALNGIVGIETLLPLSLELVRKELLYPEQLVKALSLNPARALGVPGGSLDAGSAADVTVIDLEAEWTVTPESLRSKSKNSPFLGRLMKGRARYTIVGGRVRFP